MGLFIVLLGAPGVGKGTQADLLSRELRLPHVSSGELFREAIKSKTPLGIEAQGYLGRGELVPDALTIAMVRERLSRPDCAGGVVLDGFPRTIEQAKELDGILAEGGAAVSLVPYIKAETATLLKRLGGRWTCRNCQTVYHVLYNPPREPGKAASCISGLMIRPRHIGGASRSIWTRRHRWSSSIASAACWSRLTANKIFKQCMASYWPRSSVWRANNGFRRSAVSDAVSDLPG